ALYYFSTTTATWRTTNEGTLLDPPLSMADLEIRDEAGRALSRGRTWWLWVVPAGPCDAPCREALHQLRQLHALLNRDASRVRRALVAEVRPSNADLAREYPKLSFLSGSLAPLERGIYVVDPLGNVILHYPMEDAGEPVLDDLEHLLRVSQIG
ncbi:MAG: hypothetical protein ACODAC_04700, partial [Pseudomonadota bacterium]